MGDTKLGELKKVTEENLNRMSWPLRALRWYQTLPRELRTMKPENIVLKRIIDKWAKNMLKAINGDKIFRGMVTQVLIKRTWEEDDLEHELDQ